VDGARGGGATGDRVCGEERLKIDRRLSRLPIVRVDDRGTSAATNLKFQGGADEDRKPTGVVRVVTGFGPVEAIAIVQRRFVHQDRASRSERCVENADIGADTADPQVKSIDQLATAAPPVPRDREYDVPPETGQRLRQRTKHVSQPPGF